MHVTRLMIKSYSNACSCVYTCYILIFGVISLLHSVSNLYLFFCFCHYHSMVNKNDFNNCSNKIIAYLNTD